MIQIYKPNKSCSGHAISFFISKAKHKGEKDSVMLQILKQDSWDDKKKVASFSKSKNDQSGTRKVTVKLSDVEVAELSRLLLMSKGKFSAVHSSDSNTCNISVSKKEMENRFLKKTEIHNSIQVSKDGTSFFILTNEGESVLISEFLRYSLVKKFENFYNSI